MKIIFALLFSLGTSSAENYSHNTSDLASANLQQEGQLVTVRLVLGEPLRIFVVGREEAKLDFADLKLTVKRLKPYPGKVLRLSRNGDYFAVSEAMSFESPTDIEVKTKVKDKEETFKFKIDNQPH